jgi:hypothetical protein
MSRERPEPVRVQLPPAAWAGIAIILVLLFATFWFMTKVLLDQRHLIDSQNRKAFAQLERLTPVLRETRPVLAEAQRQAKPARQTLRDTRRLTQAAQPLVESLARADLPAVAQVTGEAAAVLVEGDRLPHALNAVMVLADEVQRARLPQTLAALGDLAPRATEALDRTNRLLRELRRRHATSRLLRAADETVRVRRRTDTLIEMQRQAMELQTELLAIQKEALRRIESLDNKTGGPALAPAAPKP